MSFVIGLKPSRITAAARFVRGFLDILECGTRDRSSVRTTPEMCIIALDAHPYPGGNERESVIFLRKFGQEDPRERPLFAMCGFEDWIYRNGAVGREEPFLNTSTGKVSAWSGAGLITASGIYAGRVLNRLQNRDEASQET
jgi:hypothetical protein